MATYTPEQLGIKPPAGGFQTGGWYQGRQYWGGTLSDPNVIHPQSNQQGAGQPVSAEVRAQSAAQQGVSPQQFDEYLRKQGATPQQLPQSNAIYDERYGVSSTPSASRPQTPNLQEAYDKLFNTPEMKGLKEEQAKTEAERDRAISEIQNNPWFSSATTVGKIAQINADAEKKLTRVNNELARMQADAQIQYNIVTDQYTIDRQAYQDTLTQFNNLLQLGAFNNASGQDIAQWASATGISTSAIQSMVKTAQKKDLSLQSYDDGTNVYTLALDAEGNIVNKTLIGRSKPSGGSDYGSGRWQYEQSAALNAFLEGSKNSYGHVSPTDWRSALGSYVEAGLGTSLDFYKAYALYTDPNRGDFQQAYGFSKDMRQAVELGVTTP
jgi:hypothetical protein